MPWQFSNKQKNSFHETGVSDHQKLIGTMLRSTFAKGEPTKSFTAVTKSLIMKSFKKN